MRRVIGRVSRVRQVLLTLLLAGSLIGAQVALPGLALSAAAQSKATPTITTTPSAGGPVGTSISDSATVSSEAPGPTTPPTSPETPPSNGTETAPPGTTNFPSQPGLPSTGSLSVAPTGTVTFELFPPGDPTCVGKPVFTDPEVRLDSSGTATSGSFSDTNTAGTWNWIATYNGDDDNNPVSTKCGDERVAITAAPPATFDIAKKLLTAAPPGGEPAPASPDTKVQSGGELVYKIIVTNNGGSEGTITLTDPVPEGTTYTGGATEGWTCVTPTVAGSNCIQTVTVPAGESDTLHYTVTVDNPVPEGLTTIDNTVTSSTSATCSPCETTNTIAGRIYWTDKLSVPTKILSANKDGSGIRTLITGQARPEDVVVTDGQIYWDNSLSGPDGSIWQADLSNPQGTAHQIIGGQNLPFGLTVDNTYIYWAEFGAHRIGRANRSNPAATETTIMSGRDYVSWPVGVAVDSTNLYWGASDNYGPNGRIMKAQLASCHPPVNCTNLTTLVGPRGDYPSGVAVGNGHIYWTLRQNANQIWEADLNDFAGTAHVILDLAPPSTNYIAVDSTNIYWTTGTNGTVMAATLASCQAMCTDVRTLVTSQAPTQPTGIAVGPP